jgi:hypothetical protein
MTRKISIKGFKLKDGKVVKDHSHLPVNIRLQKAASKKVRVGKR